MNFRDFMDGFDIHKLPTCLLYLHPDFSRGVAAYVQILHADPPIFRQVIDGCIIRGYSLKVT
jgi:hypothetical protein